MKRYSQPILIILLIFCVAVSFSCTKKGVKKDTGITDENAAAQSKKPGEEGLEEAQAGGPKWNEATAEMAACFKDIYFNYDQFVLSPEGKTALNKMGEWLLKNRSTQVLVEGHCDERGTAEYNLALSERRAHSAKKYLADLGVSADRISTISYGEERPVDPGHAESAWAKNRRCHFLYR